MHGNAAGDDGQLFTLEMLGGFAELKGRSVLVNRGIATPTDTEVHRLVVSRRGFDGCHQLRPVGRRDYRQVSNRTHGGDVFSGVVRGAVEAQRDASVVADQSYWLSRVSHVHANLFAAQQTQEGGECCHERHDSAGRGRCR